MATVLHLLPTSDWLSTAHLAPVVNASLDEVGFIHCTDSHDVLLNVANTFYVANDGDFTALHIDTERLLSPCVWEAPARPSPTDADLAPLFPHIYGVLDRQAVVAAQALVRNESGQFVGFGDAVLELG